jgi:hypothetical protein
LLTEFALHLVKHADFVISLFGEDLDAGDAIESREEVDVEMPEGVTGTAKLTVIEWKLENVRRSIYLCDGTGRVIDEVLAQVQAPGVEFTAYLEWDGFEDMGPLSVQDDGESNPGRVIDAAREALKAHLRESQRRREAKKIGQWQAEGVYPFKGDPSGPLEEVTRATFNVVATAASRTFDDTKSSKTKALSLSLLRQALENDPDSLLPILHEVAKLPKARLDELSALLKQSSLSHLIQLGHAVTGRVDFLASLEEVLFERKIKRRMLERRQLHRILAHETWIFGEEWSLTGDDERLTKVLKKFLTNLGKEEGEVELATAKPVLRSDGRDAIPDLVLGRQLSTEADRLENLVVELKRPDHVLTDLDVTQLRSYASAIVNNEMFDQPNVSWDFWLVGNELKPEVSEQRDNPSLPSGCIQVHSKYRIFVKTWAEIITECQHRLKFVQRSLQYETTRGRSLEFLQQEYGQYLPDEVGEVASEIAADEAQAV